MLNNYLFLCNYSVKPSMGRMMIYYYVKWQKEEGLKADVVHSGGNASLYPELLNEVLCIPFFGKRTSFKQKLKYLYKHKRNPFLSNELNYRLSNSIIIIPETFISKKGLLSRLNDNRLILLVQSPHFLVNKLPPKACFYAIWSVAPANKLYSDALFNSFFPVLFGEAVCHSFDVSDRKGNNQILDFKNLIISYMPRRGEEDLIGVLNLYKRIGVHRNKVEFVSIEGLSKHEVQERLRSSVIFLTFSIREGLGMPIIEAAIMENHIVGFHGWGAKHLFEEYDTFHFVDVGDWLGCVEKIDNVISILIKDIRLEKTRLKENAESIFNRYNESSVKMNFLEMVSCTQ